MAENSVTETVRTNRAETLYRREMQARDVPEQLHDGLVRYLVHHIPTGHFLLAILASDVPEALRRADPICQRGLSALYLFLFQVAPGNSWGDYTTVREWLALRQRTPDAHLGAVTDSSIHGGER